MQTISVKITASDSVIKCFKRFLALLHWNSRFGHSAYFGMPLDGDGSDKFTAEIEFEEDAMDEFRKEVQLISSVGSDLEYANENSYSCCSFKPLTHYYHTIPPSTSKLIHNTFSDDGSINSENIIKEL